MSNQVSFAVAHKRYVASLYKRALKTSLDWYVFRDIWRPKALEIRARFEANKDVKSFKHLKSILQAAEEELWTYRHPDPYICKAIYFLLLMLIYKE